MTARNNSSSLRRALNILEVVARFQSQGTEGPDLTMLAESTELSKSTVLRLMEPLLEAGLLSQTPSSGVYCLGPRTAYFGGIYLETLDLRTAARDLLEEAVAVTSETAHLVAKDGVDVTYIDKVESPRAVRMYSRIGGRMPMYCTGAGKAILAYSNGSILAEVLSMGMPARTPNTITDGKRIQQDLENIRMRGYSIDDVENEIGIRCVGAAVFDHAGEAIAAVSISGPDNLVTKDRVEELGKIVLATANQLSERFGSTRRLP